MSKEKSRYFTFLLYPESIPNDWLEKLSLFDVPMAVSPLHDKDKSDVEGQEYKKSHYHVIYIAKNPVTAESVRLKIKRSLGNDSVALVQIISTSIENMYLYLTHESKDAIAKNKHIYAKKDIKLLSNFDIDRYITLDAEEKEVLFNLVCDIIHDYDIANMRELKRFIETQGSGFGLPNMKIVRSVLRVSTSLVRLTFDGVYQERKNGIHQIKECVKVNEETGEVIEDE